MTDKEQAIRLKLKKARALLSEVDTQLENHFFDTALTGFIIVAIILPRLCY